MGSLKKKKQKVFVGLSGGVDSSVSAYLLKKQGYDVVGVFIKVWQPDFVECDWKKDRRDAMRICAKLNIPYLFFDFEKEYKKEVADYMIREYEAGRTPNPDVMCNRYIKFGAFLDKALAMGADYVATGHYSRVEKREKRKEGKNNGLSSFNLRLLTGQDSAKDQSYFLWTLGQKELSKILFPVGHLKKSEVRKIAKGAGLITADKKDSQGLCFVGKVEMKEFLNHFIKTEKGRVVDHSGHEIGEHDGAFYYTIGQRHGFKITRKGSADKPMFVIGKDMKRNAITVSDNPNTRVEKSKTTLSDVNWISGKMPKTGKNYLARFRYRQALQECKITGSDKGRVRIMFSNNQPTLAPGQSLVFYDGEECLGGGVIE